MIDGVLAVDKPQGLTSHDVVVAARRALEERRIGHTGTLDPMATGVLPLACGRATRLAQFLAAADKDYDAEIRLGLTTDTYDITGREVARSELTPPSIEVAAALDTLSGDYLQTPPPYSAKKIQGRRSYDLARADARVELAPVPVSVSRLELGGVRDRVVTLRITCSAGFYVRSLAHELGLRLGTGACLQALRRTRSGDFPIADAISVEVLVGDPMTARARVVPMERLLASIPAVTLTDEGVTWVAHGRVIGPAQVAATSSNRGEWVRLLGPDGALVAMGRQGGASGLLHPSVVLI